LKVLAAAKHGTNGVPWEILFGRFERIARVYRQKLPKKIGGLIGDVSARTYHYGYPRRQQPQCKIIFVHKLKAVSPIWKKYLPL
jgi:hypothetical protein